MTDNREWMRDIAIVGMACRVPGAEEYLAYWRNLVAGARSIGTIPTDRWDAAEHYSSDVRVAARSVSQWGGFLRRVFDFDAAFFGISAHEATQMDPQQRLALEEAWHCLEDAGMTPKALRCARTAVYVGAMAMDHYAALLAPSAVADAVSCSGAFAGMLANRLSYVLGLCGPSYALDAACASSLVAVHEGCKSIAIGECDFALVAGVSLNLTPWKYVSFSQARMLSPDGLCRTFDEGANGYVPGDGVGVLLITTLERALAERRPVHAVIKGTAVNHGGASASLTAPRVAAQREVILEAYRRAGLSPATTGYVEAHGTGTSLGDPIELEALSQVFRGAGQAVGSCSIGSVKTNIGHLEAAAGIVGVIKVAMMLRRGQIPPTLNLRRSNPVIVFDSSPFRPAIALSSWHAGEHSRRAGVSSFGFGGANAHVVLEESLVQAASDRPTAGVGPYPFILSAKTPMSLRGTLARWARSAAAGEFDRHDLVAMCRTVVYGRESFPVRFGVLVRSQAELRAAVECAVRGETHGATASVRTVTHTPRVVLEIGAPISVSPGSLPALLETDPELSSLWRSHANKPEPFASDPSDQELAAFLLRLGEVRRVLALGVIPERVHGDGVGFVVALVASGALEPKRACALLAGGSGVEPRAPLILHRPRYPLWDPIRGVFLRQYLVDTSYWREVAAASLGAQLDTGELVAAAVRLAAAQHTYRRFLQHWTRVSFIAALLRGEPGNWQTLEPTERATLNLALLVSWRRLQQKWQLTGDLTRASQGLQELGSLVLSDIVMVDEAIDMLAGVADLEELTAAAVERLDRVGVPHDCALLNRRGANVDEIEDARSWLEQWRAHAIAPPRTSLVNDQRTLTVAIGRSSALGAAGPDVAWHSECADSFLAFALELWRRGCDMNWTSLLDKTGDTVAGLPGYVFERRHYRVQAREPTQASAAATFKLVLNPEHDSVVADHVIAGEVVVPAAVHLEFAFKAGREAGLLDTLEDAGELLDVTIHRPARFAGDQPLELVLVLKSEEQARCRFSIEQSGRRLADGAYGPLSEAWPRDDGSLLPVSLLPVSFGDARSGGREHRPTDIYGDLSAAGYDYRASLRVIAAATERDGRYVFELAPASVAPTRSGVLDPALLDGAFQAVLWRLLQQCRTPSAGLLVPYRIGRMRLQRPLSNECTVIVDDAQLSEMDRGWTSAFEIRDREGGVLVRVEGMLWRHATWAAFALPSSDPIARHLYMLRWQQTPSVLDARAACNAPPGRGDLGPSTLLFCDRASRSVAARVLNAIGSNGVIVQFEPDDSVEAASRFAGSTDVIGSKDEFQRRLAETQPPSRIFFFWRAGLPISCGAGADAERGALALFRLAKALLEQDSLRDCELHIVTAGAQRVVERDAITTPAGGALAGLAKVLALEEGVRASWVDLDPFDLDGSAAMMAGEHGGAPLNELAYRDGTRYVLCLSPINSCERGGRSRIRQRGVYLIIGGRSGIGWEIARHLVEHWAARVMLVGRRSADAELDAKIAALSELGGEVSYCAADVTREADIVHAVAEAKRRFGALNGVIHSALELADARVRNMDEAMFLRVLAAKVRGSELLVEAVAGEELDFLVFFSSVLALQGNIGQANYVAACRFQAAYSAYLRQRNWPALTINWGYWGEAGIVRHPRFKELLHKQGVDAFTNADGVQAFLDALGAEEPEMVAAKLSAERYLTMTFAPEDAATTPVRRGGRAVALAEVEGAERVGVAADGFGALEAFAQSQLLRVIQDAGLFGAPGARCRPAELARTLGVLPKLSSLLDDLIAVLVGSGLVQRDGEELVATERAREVMLSRHDDSDAMRAAFCREHPDKARFYDLLNAGLGGLRDVLSGRIRATELLFPSGSMALVEGIYHGNALADLFNDFAARALSTHIQELSLERRSDEPVRVVELGAGTGATTAVALQALEAFGNQLEYHYTDLSYAFLREGRSRFGTRYPFVRYGVLDLEKAFEPQGFAAATFDAVLAVNAVHATRDIAATVARARRLLRDDGLLVLGEYTQGLSFLTLTFGLLDGWRLAQDRELRIPHQPLLSPEGWRALCVRVGFGEVHVHTPNGLPHSLVLAGGAPAIAARTDAARTDAARTDAARTDAARTDAARSSSETAEIERQIQTVVARLRGVEIEEIAPDQRFADLGLDSILGVEAVRALNDELKLDMETTILYDYPSIRELASEVDARLLKRRGTGAVGSPTRAPSESPEATGERRTHSTGGARAPSESPEPIAATRAPRESSFERGTRTIRVVDSQSAALRVASQSEPAVAPIAVIGMAGRFPGASDLEELWEILATGRSVAPNAFRRWGRTDGFATLMDGVDEFDPLFFEISPKEAARMDPQQRLFLQESWKALENAGYAPDGLSGTRAGVFAGVRPSDYLYHALQAEAPIDSHLFVGNDSSILASRIAYLLNLRGPCVAVDTACSSSLAAIHLACEALRRGEIDMALAGGVFVMSTPQFHTMAAAANMLAGDGHCKTFDQSADGFVPGEGVGVLVLKPLEAAERDGDPIHGVILGSALNQDGRTNGITAPSSLAQSDVEREAYRRACVSPDTITLVEAHGTGTKLGDPIEIEALARSFATTRRRHFCAIGSIKTNLGHTITAAGVAGVLKVLLAFRAKRLPPTCHFERLNPHIRLVDSPFYLNTRLSAWEPEHGTPRRAAVSAFGFSGTNCHLVIEEWRGVRDAHYDGERAFVFPLAARTEKALREKARALSGWLRAHPDTRAVDVAYTLAVGRSHFRKRLAIVAAGLEEVASRLDAWSGGARAADCLVGTAEPNSSRPAFRSLLRVLERELSANPSAEQNREHLLALADVYVDGLDPDWRALFASQRAWRVALPTYPFERERFWLERVTTDAPARLNSRDRNGSDSSAVSFLRKDWRRSAIAHASARTGNYLVLVSEPPDATLLPTLERITGLSLRLLGPRVTCAGLEVDWTEWRDGQAAAARALAQGPVDGVLDLSDCQGSVIWDPARLELGKAAFVQALIAAQFGLERENTSLVLLHFTRGLQPIHSETGTCRGGWFAPLLRALRAEYPAFLRAVTIDLDPREPLEPGRWAALIRDELAAQGDHSEVAYRGGVRLTSCLQRCEGVVEPYVFEPARDGVYVVTGGTRGLGFAVAEHLVQRGARRLVLMGYEALPPRDAWPAIVSSGANSAVAKKVAGICALERAGAKVALFLGPLTDRPQLEAFFVGVRRDLGPIRGVVHSAMASLGPFDPFAETPFFVDKSAQEIEACLAPKVTGTCVLADILRSDPLEFFLSFSSVASAIPSRGVGYTAYAAANGFLDRFTLRQVAEGRSHFRCINWVYWNETGAVAGERHEQRLAKYGIYAMSTAEGLAAIERVIAGAEAQVVVGRLGADLLREAGVDTSRPAASGPPRALESTHRLALQAEPETCNFGASPAADVSQSSDQTSIEDRLARIFGSALGIRPEALELHASFDQYGVDSILMGSLVKAIEAEFGVALNPGLLLEYPTLAGLTGHLRSTGPRSAKEAGTVAASSVSQSRAALRAKVRAGARIAIIGMAARFPEAPTKEAFWQNLRSGRGAIREVPRDRWDLARFFDPRGGKGKSYAKWGGFLSDIEQFDPAFFGISEQDAALMDPEARQFLEQSVEAVLDAGYTSRELAGRAVAVFAAAQASAYAQWSPFPAKFSIVGSGHNFVAANVAHHLDLVGPNLVLHTGCSSSLVALHLACQSLRSGESELAIVGGVNLLLDEQVYLLLSEAKALSPEGRCYAFDARANGFVPGEGCACAVLKPLEAALAAGDRIYAVIDGTATNNDGHTMGITTPSVEAQSQVVRRALLQAEVDPDALTYIEAHGTGTMVGDPIELHGLMRVFRESTQDRGFCAVGSVKSNIGHTLLAAGMAGLVKLALSLTHRELAPTINCELPNPRFGFEDSPFYPNQRLSAWEPRRGLRRAGLSAFGLGGTNAHVVLSELTPEEAAAWRPLRVALGPAPFVRRRCWIERSSPGVDEPIHVVPKSVSGARATSSALLNFKLEAV